ncbi:hypothetical protein TNCT_271041 [Trichonephila clavata]|uniref:Uncharacterized protein n=1 Tax=Trichonephila clavata TaxID=2740835 RepID=A0A8X6HU29_TRICU|nr:hypothetical protein TNCT_271041 [Trichonephila clavata]
MHRPDSQLLVCKISVKKEFFKNDQKSYVGRPRSSTSPTRERSVIESFHQSSRKSVRQAACETRNPKSSVHLILKCAQWKIFIPRLVYAFNNDDQTEELNYVSGSQIPNEMISNILDFDQRY